ncbi:MAG: putative NADH:ubiquinone oxidoreductase, subunit RnfD [Oscillospiraceae bacterium]|jgi:electron transport complex protein RnfD|nr:putative NADH:ubiquinone oxidoreductase, subunit RnfD [Oscillospiraceae bacterium]
MLQSRSTKTEFSAMADILFVAVVLTFMCFYYYGLRAVAVVLVSVLSSFLTDFICVKIRKQKYDRRDLTAFVSGAVLGLMMPASVPYEIVIGANVFAIIVVKQAFGGHGKNIFSIPAVGFLFSSLCWKENVLMYPAPFDSLSLSSHVQNTLVSSFTQTLGIAKNPSVSYFDIFLGKFAGPMGATHIIILLVCAVVLMFRRSISALTFCGGLGSFLLFSYIFPKFGDSAQASVFYELFAGMTVFGMIFLACDYYALPKIRFSRFLYGFVVGFLSLLFRHLSSVENAVVFAVVIASPLAISLDKSVVAFGGMTKDLFNSAKDFVKTKMQYNAEKQIEVEKENGKEPIQKEN